TFQGSTSGLALSRPIVAMATTADGTGYWLVAADGGIFSFNAPFYGALAGWPLAQPVVGMTATPTGHGYWIVTGDGAVFPFGDARFEGSASGLVSTDHHVVQMVGMPTGDGYRMLALRSVPDVGLMGMGATGAAVTDVQSRLLSMGYWLPGANGVFDSDMQQAIWAFQKANGL